MIIKIMILGILLGICPPMIGCIWTGYTENSRGNLAAAYLYGLITMLTCFEVLAVPMCYFRTSLTLLSRSYLAVLAVLILVSLIKNKILYREQWKWLIAQRKKMTLLLCAAMACILLQGGYVTLRQHIDEDDAFYLATATTSVETNSLYKRSPYTGKKYRNSDYNGNLRYITASWPIFIAFLSQVSHMHATIIAHMILPAVVLFWMYLIYFLYGNYLFGEQKHKLGLFMLFVVTLVTFSGYSVYSGNLFPLIRGWQGKAVLAGVMLPAILYGCLAAMKQSKLNVQWLMLFGMVGAAVTVSSMGVALSSVTVAAASLVQVCRTKDVRFIRNGFLVCLPAAACALVYVVSWLL